MLERKAKLFEILTRYRKIFRNGNSIDKETIKIYSELLSQYEPENVQAALERVRHAEPFFPAMADIEKELGYNPETDENIEGRARLVTAALWSAIGRFPQSRRVMAGGRFYTEPKPEAIEAAVGDIGMEIIRLEGGWDRLKEQACSENAAFLKAQWRELAIAILKRHKHGLGKSVPTLTEGTELGPRRGLVKMAEVLKLAPQAN